jgi:hypothetical protein
MEHPVQLSMGFREQLMKLPEDIRRIIHEYVLKNEYEDYITDYLSKFCDYSYYLAGVLGGMALSDLHSTEQGLGNKSIVYDFTPEQITHLLEKGSELLLLRIHTDNLLEEALNDHPTLSALFTEHQITSLIEIPGTWVEAFSENGDELFKFFTENIGILFSVTGAL